MVVFWNQTNAFSRTHTHRISDTYYTFMCMLGLRVMLNVSAEPTTQGGWHVGVVGDVVIYMKVLIGYVVSLRWDSYILVERAFQTHTQTFTAYSFILESHISACTRICIARVVRTASEKIAFDIFCKTTYTHNRIEKVGYAFLCWGSLMRSFICLDLDAFLARMSWN